MALKRTPRPRDPIQLGKLMVDIATGAVPDGVDDGKDAAAVSLGQRGGVARAQTSTQGERSEIAKRAAKARWEKKVAPVEGG